MPEEETQKFTLRVFDSSLTHGPTSFDGEVPKGLDADAYTQGFKAGAVEGMRIAAPDSGAHPL